MNLFVIKILAFFSLIKIHNIIIVAIAQYLVANFLIAPEKLFTDIIFNQTLLKLVLATFFTIAGGYIINSFFDAEKDQINRPKKYILDHTIPLRIKFFLYLIFNLIALLIAYFISIKAILFFGGYIFLIVAYSYYIKRFYWVSNIISAVLVVVPFFAITIHYKNFSLFIFYQALFLFLLILIRDFIKDLENFKGDWVHQYKTFPIVFNDKITKYSISFLAIALLLPIYKLIQFPILGTMRLFFLISIPFLIYIIIKIWQAKTQKNYLWCHNLIKTLILIGVFSIILVRF